MEKAYISEFGFAPELKEKLILELLAGEIHALSESFEWYKAQAFPETASGEYLDKHAATYGLIRLAPNKAKGELLFTRSDGLSYQLTVPKGTVCSDSAGREYITTAEAKLSGGIDRASVPAEAAVGGSDYNCVSGLISCFVTKPAGITSVTNLSAFSGGTDEESDLGLRTRLLKALSAPADCYNREFYRREAMSFPGVSSADISSDGAGKVTVYLWGEGTAVADSLIQELSLKLNSMRELNVSITVKNAVAKSFDCTVYVSPMDGCDFETAKQKVNSALREYRSALGVGDAVYLSAVLAYIMENAPVKKCSFSTAFKDVPAEPSAIPVAGSISVQQI